MLCFHASAVMDLTVPEVRKSKFPAIIRLTSILPYSALCPENFTASLSMIKCMGNFFNVKTPIVTSVAVLKIKIKRAITNNWWKRPFTTARYHPTRRRKGWQIAFQLKHGFCWEDTFYYFLESWMCVVLSHINQMNLRSQSYSEKILASFSVRMSSSNYIAAKKDFNKYYL